MSNFTTAGMCAADEGAGRRFRNGQDGCELRASDETPAERSETTSENQAAEASREEMSREETSRRARRRCQRGSRSLANATLDDRKG